MLSGLQSSHSCSVLHGKFETPVSSNDCLLQYSFEDASVTGAALSASFIWNLKETGGVSCWEVVFSRIF
jgi:hypothetical protein